MNLKQIRGFALILVSLVIIIFGLIYALYMTHFSNWTTFKDDTNSYQLSYPSRYDFEYYSDYEDATILIDWENDLEKEQFENLDTDKDRTFYFLGHTPPDRIKIRPPRTEVTDPDAIYYDFFNPASSTSECSEEANNKGVRYRKCEFADKSDIYVDYFSSQDLGDDKYGIVYSIEINFGKNGIQVEEVKTIVDSFKITKDYKVNSFPSKEELIFSAIGIGYPCAENEKRYKCENGYNDRGIIESYCGLLRYYIQEDHGVFDPRCPHPTSDDFHFERVQLGPCDPKNYCEE